MTVTDSEVVATELSVELRKSSKGTLIFALKQAKKVGPYSPTIRSELIGNQRKVHMVSLLLMMKW